MGYKIKYTYRFLHNVYQHSIRAADRSGDDEN